MKQPIGAAAFIALLGSSHVAQAGGLETPDNGTEALGRGGAFVAKADDPTALHHNVGGLAQQRGTRLLLNANVGYSSLSFQRAGRYPGAEGSAPWAGRRFPLAENEGKPVVLPFLAATSDLGTEHLTVAIGTFPPSSVGGLVYPIVRNGMPSPTRYDAIGGMSTILLFHTAAFGYRIADSIDIGAALHVVQASIGTRMLEYIDRLPGCDQPENASCDARGEAKMTGWSATGSVGVILRPRSDVAVGLHFRGPTSITAEGKARLSAPTGVNLPLPNTRVMLQTALPWVLRAGVRKQFKGEEGTGDIELDGIYEAWSSAMDPGPRIVLENLGPLGRKEVTVDKHYKDTFSVRLGGSYNPKIAPPLTLRGGAFYDASATDPSHTRLDNDTLDKVALTAGIGLQLGVVLVNVAYASVFSISRTVEPGTGQIRVGDDPSEGAINEGSYQGHMHVGSIGVVVELDRIFGGIRVHPPSLDRDRDRIARR